MAEKPRDVVLVHSPTEDGKGMNVLRAREERLETGILRPLEHGKPIQGEVVKLEPRPGSPRVFDAETQVPAPAVPASAAESADVRRGSGPAQVATEDYRKGWDAIWKRAGQGRKQLVN